MEQGKKEDQGNRDIWGWGSAGEKLAGPCEPEVAEFQQGQYLSQVGRKMGHSSQEQGGRRACVEPRPQVVIGMKERVWTAGSI